MSGHYCVPAQYVTGIFYGLNLVGTFMSEDSVMVMIVYCHVRVRAQLIIRVLTQSCMGTSLVDPTFWHGSQRTISTRVSCTEMDLPCKI